MTQCTSDVVQTEFREASEAWVPSMSHENHFRFGYNGRCFNARMSRHDQWWVTYGRSARAALGWREECIEVARLIGQSASAPIWLLFSGGIDSEVVVQSFMFAGVPFTVAITEFERGMNQHDVQYAVQFCERHELPFRKLRLDIAEFFASGAATRFAEETHCVQPQLLHTMWAMDQVEGFPVLGSGECLLVHEPGNGADGPCCVLYEKERIASWYRYLMVRGRPGCAGFFQYTPEVMLAFIEDEDVRAFAQGLHEGQDSTEFKAKLYRKYYLLQRRPKFHGFENVMQLDARLRPELEDLHGDWNQIYRTEYGDLVRLLAGN